MRFEDGILINTCVECKWSRRVPSDGYAGQTSLACGRPELSVDLVTGVSSDKFCSAVRKDLHCEYFTKKASVRG